MVALMRMGSGERIVMLSPVVVLVTAMANWRPMDRPMGSVGAGGPMVNESCDSAGEKSVIQSGCSPELQMIGVDAKTGVLKGGGGSLTRFTVIVREGWTLTRTNSSPKMAPT